MICIFCGTRNREGEGRCRHCGRKPDDTLSGQALHLRTEGALAPVPAAEPEARAERPNLSRAVQGLLFPKRPEAKVIPFESYFAEAVGKPARQSRARAAGRVRPKPAGPVRLTPENQDWLSPEWAPVSQQPARASAAAESAAYFQFPLATMLHRSVATVVDWALVLVGYGLLLTAYGLMGGGFQMNRTNLLVFAGMFSMVAFTYGLLFALAGGETAGMRWAHLRLTTFEGSRPTVPQRIHRYLGSCLSVCTVLGLAWPLCDENSLSLPDQISQTFPTPALFDWPVLHRV